ncbi:sugar lactone lactonase YvrE [Nocardioides ginsengisegetis]|uniref:Sugar lactone lactonase YvrE n=1 Tax=Nocardioides ginsengisegetis TaxID=661491 RepID=A0A7W3PAX4_9ACTN|nr:hypothetical protein [Nocardioides ginsengisegetis]MBA8805048.1 sugar lactone lactonase YvrE [Nocardioides ginsengisegetis]
MADRILGVLAAVPFLLGTVSSSGTQGTTAFTFADPEIIESSALVVQDGLFLTTNDSGDSGRVFAVDPATGRTVGVTHWSEDPVDVEALAPAGPGHVWVGDIGDNGEGRDSVRITRVPVGAADATVHEPAYELVYPDRAHNAETLLSDPRTGRVYVATKDVFGGRLYAVPRHLSATSPNRLRAVGDVLPIATDGAFFPDGRHLVLRDYSMAVVYAFPSMEKVGEFRLPVQDQGEGIAVDARGTLFVSSEGQHEPVLRVSLPAEVRDALTPPSAATPPPSPSPGVPDRSIGIQVDDRPVWPWLLTGGIGVAALVVLLRSLRPR